MLGGTEHVVFTTPYIVVHPDFADWLAYFRRTFPATAGFGAYDHHMKYGPAREYWNDYVFKGLREPLYRKVAARVSSSTPGRTLGPAIPIRAWRRGAARSAATFWIS